MGVYGGRLEPTEAFEQVRPVVEEVIREMERWPTDEAKLHAAYARRDALGLTVHTTSGAVLEPLTVHLDVDEEVETYQLRLLGLGWEEAAQYFGEGAA